MRNQGRNPVDLRLLAAFLKHFLLLMLNGLAQALKECLILLVDCTSLFGVGHFRDGTGHQGADLGRVRNRPRRRDPTFVQSLADTAPRGFSSGGDGA